MQDRWRIIDLSHTISKDVPRFPKLPEPKISALWTHEDSRGWYEGCSSAMTLIEMATSVGTYVDAPIHFDPEGRDVSQMPLQSLILEGVVIDVRKSVAGKAIDPELLENVKVRGRAALFCTGWDQYWRRRRYYEHPFVGKELIDQLIEKGVKLVGIDALNVDDVRDSTRPAHSRLLRRGTPIAENLSNLEELLNRDFTFFAVPAKVKGAVSFPVRAFAILSHSAQSAG